MRVTVEAVRVFLEDVRVIIGAVRKIIETLVCRGRESACEAVREALQRPPECF